jgi:hypothetical protein
MGRPKTRFPAPSAPPPEPEEESQEAPEEEEDREEEDDQEETKTPGGTVKKAEAVRQALAAGHDSPPEAVAFIKQRFGIDMAKQHFSAVKSQLKKREAEGGGEPKKRGPRKTEAVEGNVAPPPKKAAGQPDLLAAMEAMKPLVASLGADKVKRLVDLLG